MDQARSARRDEQGGVGHPPAKPKKQKEVYYNIVGEPIDTDDE